MIWNWNKNDPNTGKRVARIFLNDEEFSGITLRTVQGALIFKSVAGAVYDRVDIDEAGNFINISYSVQEGTRGHRYRGEQGRRLIHTMVLIRDEVQHIFKHQ